MGFTIAFRRLRDAKTSRQQSNQRLLIRVVFKPQAEEAAKEQADREEAVRKAAIVAEERARLLRGAAHLRAFLPRRDALDIDTLVGRR